MPKFSPNDTVFCSTLQLDKKADTDEALVEGKVISVAEKSAIVDFRSGIGIRKVGTVRLHKKISFLLIEFGDFANESTNLDPLAKSILAFLRLLISDGALVKFIKLRSEQELEYSLKHYGAYSHIILVGHGTAKGCLLAGDSVKITSATMTFLVERYCETTTTFLSMCCHSGEAAFAKAVSSSSRCGILIAPLGPIHSCSASQFVQSFLSYHLLDGMRPKSAFDKARENTPGSASLRFWKGGRIF